MEENEHDRKQNDDKSGEKAEDDSNHRNCGGRNHDFFRGACGAFVTVIRFSDGCSLPENMRVAQHVCAVKGWFRFAREG